MDQNVGEPSRAGPRVQADTARTVHPERVEGRVELEPAASRPGVVAIGEPHPGGGIHWEGPAVRTHALDLDEAGGDQRLGAVASAGKAALNKQVVEAGGRQRWHSRHPTQI